MEFLEALRRAKDLGIDEAEFKVQWDREREEKISEREERQREHEYNLNKIQREKESAELRGSDSNLKAGVAVKGPKIPTFVDSREDLDSYLKRFERLARANNWAETTWADRLGALLTGKALDVYSGLSDEESRDYESVKSVLFQKYLLTAESYRKRFRGAKVDREETYTQLSVRLRRYLDRWVQLSKSEETLEGLLDLFVREQMLNVVDPSLAVHLRERDPKSVVEMVQMADLYQEAHVEDRGRSKTVKHGKAGVDTKGKSYGGNDREKERGKGCFKCGSHTHIARFCSVKEKIAAANVKDTHGARGVCYICQSPHHYARSCPKRHEREVAASAFLYRGSDRQEVVVKDSEIDNGGLARAGESLRDNTSESLEESVPVRQIVLSAQMQRKMYPGRYMDSGVLGDREVSVLRDTGCTFAVVKRSLLPPGSLTGEDMTYVLMDGTTRTAPIAEVKMATPIFKGELQALEVENPIADVIIGNIDGASGGGKDETETAGAVQTRRATRELEESSEESGEIINVRDGGERSLALDDFSTAEIREAQKEDVSLIKAWEKSETERPIERDNWLTVKNGFLYRMKEDRNGQGITEQLIVPQKFRRIDCADRCLSCRDRSMPVARAWRSASCGDVH